MCHVLAGPRMAEVEIVSPGTGITGGCELQCRCWKLIPGPLEDHSRPLTLSHLSSARMLLSFSNFRRSNVNNQKEDLIENLFLATNNKNEKNHIIKPLPRS